MRELREDTFSKYKNDDAHEHVEQVLDIVGLFNILGVSHDDVMLRVFPITLTGDAKRWVDRLPPGTIDSWDLHKKSLYPKVLSTIKNNKDSLGENISGNLKQEETRLSNQDLENSNNDLLLNAALMTSITTPNYHQYYSPASPRNTSPNPSDDLTKDLLASLAISPFHDDPYIKVMQAYNNATSDKSPIPPPQAPIAPSNFLPPSSMSDPQDFFLPKNTLPPKKRAPRAQIAGFQRKQVGHDDEIVLAHVRTSTLEILIEDIQVHHRSDMKSLLDKIRELKNHKGGPPDY
ncbi:hypothetical protein Tco_0579695 [Tanacetum coccineum]